VFRKTLTILSLIGLLLSVGLWGVSYFDVRYRNRPLFVGVRRGGFEWTYLDKTGLEKYIEHVIVATENNDDYSDAKRQELVEDYKSMLHGPHFRGVYFDLDTDWLPDIQLKPTIDLFIPFWIPTLAFGFLSYPSWHGAYRRRQRRKLGLCEKCGYDLRGSKDRCPECGEGFA
jgi:hypothetical protein